MADRIGVMRDGRMAQVGSPVEVYERPVSRFVAEFLGAANILPAIVRADGVTLDLPGLHQSVRSAMAGPPSSGSSARIKTHPASPSGSATKFKHSYMP